MSELESSLLELREKYSMRQILEILGAVDEWVRRTEEKATKGE